MSDARPALPRPAMTKPPSAAEIASDYIRTLVFTGVLRSGDKVPVEEIADVLNMSRQPVREALIELGHDGLVDIDGRRGTFVAAFGPQTVRDHYELYGVLQGFAVRRVAEKRDPEVIEQLRELERSMRNTLDTAERTALNIEFIRVINHAADNIRLRRVIRGMVKFTPGDYYMTNVPDAAQGNRTRLRKLLAAVEAGDAERAAAVAIDMWTRAGEHLIDHLNELGVFSTSTDLPTKASSGGN